MLSYQVFSFVFGDGDPNQGIEEERWKLVIYYGHFVILCGCLILHLVTFCNHVQEARLIGFVITSFPDLFLQIGQYNASNGSVVIDEELAPYLDVDTTKNKVFFKFHF